MFKFFKALAELHKNPSDEICTVSTIGAVMEGVYQGTLTCEALKQRGDFGLGTFDSLDGEMIMVDGVIYRAASDGSLSRADAKKDTVAYAAVKHFRAEKVFDLNFVTSLAEFSKRINDNMEQPNVMLAIKVTGTFEKVTLRAVPKQQQPYPQFAAVSKNQTEFELKAIGGMLVGFRFPAFTGELGVSGFHFHFVSADRTQGGHVLDISLRDGHVECDISRELHALLPDTNAFDKADLNHDHGQTIATAEGK